MSEELQVKFSFWGEISEFLCDNDSSYLDDFSINSKNIQGDTGYQRIIDENTVIKDKVELASKYMIGKKMGESMVCSEGKLILQKNTVITKEIIELAEREGKLDELIINMTIADVS
jgi:hypothetical protein